MHHHHDRIDKMSVKITIIKGSLKREIFFFMFNAIANKSIVGDTAC